MNPGAGRVEPVGKSALFRPDVPRRAARPSDAGAAGTVADWVEVGAAARLLLDLAASARGAERSGREAEFARLLRAYTGIYGVDIARPAEAYDSCGRGVRAARGEKLRRELLKYAVAPVCAASGREAERETLPAAGGWARKLARRLRALLRRMKRLLGLGG